MGSEVRIVVCDAPEPRARAAATAALQRLADLDQALSDWRVDSELSRVNAAAGGPALEVGADLMAVLVRARELASLSDGAFDPTVGPLVSLWRAARAAGEPPVPEALSAALALVDWRALELDPVAGTARLDRAGMALDLGALGKGWAAQQALAVLTGAECPRSLVDLGGDLALGLPPADQPGWELVLGCALPDQPVRRARLASCGVAGSGNTEQFLLHDGVRLSHVLDPRTGAALADAPCVTVLAPDAGDADALASALMVMGPLAGRAWLAQHFPEAHAFFDEPGWSALFDGNSLEGWSTTGGPYDGPARWWVEDGLLTGTTAEDGGGGLLYTPCPGDDVELELEAWLDHPFDSGVFVRMCPPGQGRGLQLTLDDRPGGEIGGVYSDGWLAHQPLGRQVWRRDRWNHVRIRVRGAVPQLQAWINGQLVTDMQLPPGTEGFARQGLLGLQVHGGGSELGHGGRARFREIRRRSP